MSGKTKFFAFCVGVAIFAAAVIVFIVAGVAVGRAMDDLIGSEDAMAKRELSNTGVPGDESALLAKWYADFAKALKAIVLHPVGSERSLAYRQARAAQLIEQIEQIRIALGAKTSLWVGSHVPKAYTDGLRLGDAQAREAGVQLKEGLLSGSFSVVDRGAVRVLAQDTLIRLHNAATSMARRAAMILRATAQIGLAEADINRIIAGGIVEGTPRQTVLLLRDALVKVHGDTVPVPTRSGGVINLGARSYAETIVRTKTREATVKGRHDRLQEVGLDLVGIVGRISTNPCSAFLGMVFSLSGNHPIYPAYALIPTGRVPMHPNCTKSTRPFIERLATARQLEQAKGLPDAKLLLGKDYKTAARLYKDLQLLAQVKKNYAITAQQLFGGGSKAA